MPVPGAGIWFIRVEGFALPVAYELTVALLAPDQ